MCLEACSDFKGWQKFSIDSGYQVQRQVSRVIIKLDEAHNETTLLHFKVIRSSNLSELKDGYKFDLSRGTAYYIMYSKKWVNNYVLKLPYVKH
ncbi:hypothetical protein CDAR_199691 [Caerostris darwini]|uniref:Uncharacterized protein n=1 Tax=Caerostris darwini TaxID=1538125 RepID=A0AAV4V7N2_9ARAC|nr:hypothetical protein CDAR_199691 [Caerostris darwini]